MEKPGISQPLGAELPKSEYRMIDIGEKPDTNRFALATGTFTAKPETLRQIRSRTLPKGDALSLSEVAGIQGAKRTADLLPLCHPLPLSSVRVSHEFLNDTSLRIYCEVKTTGKTGVEMEALAGVSAALLCIYDLVKGVDPVLKFGEIELLEKRGGKSGHWINPESQVRMKKTVPTSKMKGVSAAILTLSDRAHAGRYEDLSGAAIESWWKEREGVILSRALLPDDAQVLKKELMKLLEKDPPQVLITTGGTGISPRDISPETIESLVREKNGKLIPGLGECLRSSGFQHTPYAWLSRSMGAMIGQTLILCLPGSPKAVLEGLTAIEPLLGHLIHTAQGGDHS